MAWDIQDFTVFFAMILGVGIAWAIARRKSRRRPYRVAAGFALTAGFLLMWINGAVGIIGSEDNDANMMYLGVLATGIVGAILARGHPRGMSRTMIVVALAQVAVAAIALLTHWGVTGPVAPWDLVILTVFFVALWLVAAWLFRKAARPANDLRFRQGRAATGGRESRWRRH